MAAGQVAQRYAQAWLSAAQDKKALPAVSADCASLLKMTRESADFRAFLASPLVSTTDQAKVIKAVSDKAQFNPLTLSLLAILGDNRRLNALPAVLEAAKQMLDAAAGATTAQVTSAIALDDKKIADIRAQLAQKFGKDVIVDTRVDPAIIGGLVVRVGSTMIDDSVKTKLDRMARRLAGNAAA